MANEEHGGWKNRETWQASLWAFNDESLYHVVREYVTEHDGDADGVRVLFEEHLYDPSEHNSTGLLGDVIGLWLDRVDWPAIAAAFAE